MRPVIEKNRFGVRHVVYIIMITICVIAIGFGVYMQFFQDEKLGVILGITKEEEDTELNNLKDNFFNIFSNNIDVLEAYDGKITKIKEDMEVVVTAYTKEEQGENYSINLKIPYFNVKSEEAVKINKEIQSTFVNKVESVSSSKSENSIIYNVKYKAYIHKNILSLAILSELKEENSNQRIIIQTYNYNLSENKLVTIGEIIQNKNIDVTQANKNIKETIDSSQSENIKLKELGYEVDLRNSDSEEYKIQNADQFFIGEKGYLYIVYPYGNKEFTSEMDLIIFR